MLFKSGDDVEKRIVEGAVLIPDKPDYDGDVLSADEILSLFERFQELYGAIDYEHSFVNVAKVISSYILHVDRVVSVDGVDVTLPKGSWIMSVKIYDDATWNEVKRGVVRGFSITAVRDLKSATKSGEGFDVLRALKDASERVTLADLGDFSVVTVSLVRNPAVKDALFYSIKSADDSAVDNKFSLFESLKSLVKTFEISGGVEGMNEEQVKAMIEESLGAFASDIVTRLDVLDEQVKLLSDAAVTAEEDAVQDETTQVEEEIAEDGVMKSEFEGLVSSVSDLASEISAIKGLLVGKSAQVDEDPIVSVAVKSAAKSVADIIASKRK